MICFEETFSFVAIWKRLIFRGIVIIFYFFSSERKKNWDKNISKFSEKKKKKTTIWSFYLVSSKGNNLKNYLNSIVVWNSNMEKMRTFHFFFYFCSFTFSSIASLVTVISTNFAYLSIQQFWRLYEINSSRLQDHVCSSVEVLHHINLSSVTCVWLKVNSLHLTCCFCSTEATWPAAHVGT